MLREICQLKKIYGRKLTKKSSPSLGVVRGFKICKMGVEPKIGGGFNPPNHPFVHRVWFSIIFTIHFGGFPPIFGNTQIVSKSLITLMSWELPGQNDTSDCQKKTLRKIPNAAPMPPLLALWLVVAAHPMNSSCRHTHRLPTSRQEPLRDIGESTWRSVAPHSSKDKNLGGASGWGSQRYTDSLDSLD